MAAKVTERLRRTWADQRAQMIEERTHTQSGRPRSPEGIADMDFEIALMDRMLSLPLGTKFDAQEIQRDLRNERR